MIPGIYVFVNRDAAGIAFPAITLSDGPSAAFAASASVLPAWVPNSVRQANEPNQRSEIEQGTRAHLAERPRNSSTLYSATEHAQLRPSPLGITVGTIVRSWHY
jgi:hypothetical protein